MSKLSDVLKKAFEEYSGRAAKSIQVHPDPQVNRTYAARIVMEDGRTHDFLVCAGDQDQSLLAMSTHDVGNLIEEAEFKTWPPKSGRLSFF